MTAVPSTQLSIEFGGKKYSGVFSVSGTLMIARIPGVGSKSAELDQSGDMRTTANDLMVSLLNEAQQQGLL